jgi:uncharacterized membrane protein YdcZ (DUF606 family)
MGWIWILPFAVGLAAVVQGGLNRQLAKTMTLPTAVLVNGIIFCLSASVYWYFRREEPVDATWPWWIIIPGVCFVCLVASQIAGSIVWDLTVEGQPVSLARWIGAGLAMLGSIVVIKG